MDEASIDSFMQEEGEIANISGSFHLGNDSRDHNEYRPNDVMYDTSDIENNTLQQGIVLPRIPVGTSMAEMERVGRGQFCRQKSVPTPFSQICHSIIGYADADSQSAVLVVICADSVSTAVLTPMSTTNHGICITQVGPSDSGMRERSGYF